MIDDVGLGGAGAHANGLPALADEPALTRRSRPARRSSAARATSSSADRRPGCSSGVPTPSRRRAGTPWPARCGSTSSRSPHSRRRSRCTATRPALGARSRCWRCSTPIDGDLAATAPSAARGHRRRPLRDRRLGRAGRRRRAAAARAAGPGGRAAQLDAPVELADALRAGEPPLIARMHEGRVLLDPRTLDRRGDRPGNRDRADTRSADERTADARHRRPHRPRQDRADPRADGRRHRPPSRGARARHLDRARLREPDAAVRPRACR